MKLAFFLRDTNYTATRQQQDTGKQIKTTFRPFKFLQKDIKRFQCGPRVLWLLPQRPEGPVPTIHFMIASEKTFSTKIVVSHGRNVYGKQRGELCVFTGCLHTGITIARFR